MLIISNTCAREFHSRHAARYTVTAPGSGGSAATKKAQRLLGLPLIRQIWRIITADQATRLYTPGTGLLGTGWEVGEFLQWGLSADPHLAAGQPWLQHPGA